MSDNSQRKSLQLPALTKKKDKSGSDAKSASKTDLPKLGLPKLNSKSSAEIPKVEVDEAESVKTEMNNPIIEQEALESVSSKNSEKDKQPRKSMSLPSLPKLSMSKPSSDSSDENESPKKELLKQAAASEAESVKEENVKDEKKSLPPAKASKSPKKQPLVVVKDLPPVSADDSAEPHEVPKFYIQNPSMKDEETVMLPPMPPELGLDDDIGNAPTLIHDPSYDSAQSMQQIDNALDQLGGHAVPPIPSREIPQEPMADFPPIPMPKAEPVVIKHDSKAVIPVPKNKTDTYSAPLAQLENDADSLLKENQRASQSHIQPIGEEQLAAADQANGIPHDPIDRKSQTLNYPLNKFEADALNRASEGAARYEVDVQRYANYDGTESGYSEDVEEAILYAARSPFSRFFSDLPSILTRPGYFWRGQVEHPATMAQLHWPHLSILIVIRALFKFIGAVQNVSIGNALTLAISEIILIFALVWGMGLILSGFLAVTGRKGGIGRAVRFVGYSITPLLVVGIISMIPIPLLAPVMDVIAMPWAFVIMGAGVYHYLREKPESIAMVTALLCGLLLILWSLLPMFIPQILGGIYRAASAFSSMMP